MIWGKVDGCECACGFNKTFLIKSDRIVCSNCGRDRICTPPIIDLIKAECACGYDKTFVTIQPSEGMKKVRGRRSRRK